MAFGLTRKFILDFNPGNITDVEFLKIAVATARKLDWNISQLNVNGFIAHTKFSFSSFGEKFRNFPPLRKFPLSTTEKISTFHH